MSGLCYHCRNHRLQPALDEMRDWLAQQLIVQQGLKVSAVKVGCSREYGDPDDWQQQLPRFKQSLSALSGVSIHFQVLPSGPHQIELEIQNMPKNWMEKTVHHIKHMFSEQPVAISQTHTTAAAADKATLQSNNRYRVIQLAMQQACRQLQQQLVAHIAIAPDDVLVVRQLQLQANDSEHETLLQQFEAEFGHAQRQAYLLKLLRDGVASANLVVSDCEVQLLHGSSEMPESECFERITQQLNQPQADEAIAIQLFGEWDLRELYMPCAEAAVVTAETATPIVATADGVWLKLKIVDAQSEQGREVQCSQFPAVIGKAGADIPVHAEFVSSRHALLQWSESQGIQFSDLDSTNGSWLNQQAQRLPAQQAVSLAVGDRLRLASPWEDSRQVNLAPRLEVLAIHIPSADTATPLIDADTQATPLLQVATPLARLQIRDADGEHLRLIAQCPFTIGRGHDQDYQVPMANLNVSGRHLFVSGVDAQGATVTNLAVQRNGVAWLETPDQRLPESFSWPWGHTLLLAPLDKQHTLALTLMPPE